MAERAPFVLNLHTNDDNDAKKRYYPLVFNCINMIRVAAWQLYVILQHDPKNDNSDFTKSVTIELLRNMVRPETARALKTGRRITNQSSGQHQPLDYLKQGRVWCKKNTTKECTLRLHDNCFLPYHATF